MWYPRLRACSFQGPPEALIISGGYGVGETPLPIPNRAVKPHSADGTWLARARESRSPPVYLHMRAVPFSGRPFLFGMRFVGFGGVWVFVSVRRVRAAATCPRSTSLLTPWRA